MGMATATTATFHPFPRLPFELRARIWELTVEPRTVEVRVVYHDPTPARLADGNWTEWTKQRLPPMRHLRSPTPVPAQLQTCREAHDYLTRHPYSGYQRAFSEIMTIPYDDFDPVPEGDPQRERYVWLNLDIDMVSIGKTSLHDLRAVARQIRRLRLERAMGDEYFARTESQIIGSRFRSLTEVHIVSLEGLRAGYGVAGDIDFPCELENVYFVDPEYRGGKMMNSVDLDAMMDRECEEFDRAAEERAGTGS